jgi:3-hydroxyacyl-CoA dehydrogenase/enoyl-CoA hydratase/3-hydroxybutyryl-CoA epimerase
MEQLSFKHWRLEQDANGIAWLHLDKAGSGANVLAREVLAELNVLIDELNRLQPKGAIILSDKPSGFIAGADINEIAAVKSSDEALDLVKFGQSVFDRLEAVACPTLALIRGFCMGGGLELALACHYRVALDDPKTRLGLPEVQLGIHPGFGGTMRLIRLIGAPAAMDLMLSGKAVDTRAALKLGIIDRSAPERHFLTAASAIIRRCPPVRRPGWLPKLANHNAVRPLLAAYLRREVAKRAYPAHYPAPFALIDLWQKHGGDEREMLKEEALSVARLANNDTTRNLVRVFFLRERLKSLGGKADTPFQRVHVIGAGIMGGDIAAWCALQGMQVTLQDREPKFIAPAMKRAHELFGKRIRDRRLRQAAVDRLTPDVHGDGVRRADVVIEAIIENVEAKQALYRAIEPRLKPSALLATNTSSIPLETLEQSLAQPGRLVGVHFFNPVAKMQLVEIISTSATEAVTLERATAFVRAIDRLPLPVKSAPGFLVNRILLPYMLESITLTSEGVPVETIDRAAREFGMPMGPLELADTVGLDICLSVGDILAKHTGSVIPPRLREMVSQGLLGRKSGRGFYEYRKGKLIHAKQDGDVKPLEPIADRLIQKIIKEAKDCLREGIVEDDTLLDAGMIFGTGFAPFRGGPMHYAKQRGLSG